MLSDTQQKFLEISKRLEVLKEESKALYPTLDDLMKEIGVGTMFQDPETGLVYKIEVPTGTFVQYNTISYVRTKKAGETKGSLAKTEAEAAGFVLSK